jgi:acetylornithine/succinyldiaminopimelate/putrescine aminotransferase
MSAWSREQEVVHTSTFTGAPLACAAALATLRELDEHQLVARAQRVGERFRGALGEVIAPHAAALGAELRGAGLMIGLELSRRSGAALELTRRLLARGYVTSLGGGRRETLVLTPALDIPESLLEGFVQALAEALPGLAA